MTHHWQYLHRKQVHVISIPHLCIIYPSVLSIAIGDETGTRSRVVGLNMDGRILKGEASVEQVNRKMFLKEHN